MTRKHKPKACACAPDKTTAAGEESRMIAPAFLTEEEMRELTGRALHKRQREWLQAEGWKFTANAAGRPIVSRAHMEAMLGGVKLDRPKTRAHRPNFDAIR